jgi:hypothetical protein
LGREKCRSFSTILGSDMHLDLLRESGVVLPICPNPGAVKTMRIWHCKYKTFAPLVAYASLQELVIAVFPDESLDVISELADLRYLKIVHLPQVRSLLALARLQKLESLSLATLPSWDSAKRRTIVSSLAPLLELPLLRHVELFGVCPSDGSLTALSGLHGLETARFSGYSDSAINNFFAAAGARNEFVPPSTFEMTSKVT